MLTMSALGAVNNKLNVLQQNVGPNKLSGDQRRDLIIVRKNPQQILAPSKDQSRNKKVQQRPGAKDASRMQNPPPVAVARRNARERNRVKQVNNGFATLRQHIPTAIAAAFETNSGRGGNKKLSKVETLRMAVEYIRSLEDILSMEENESTGNISASSTSSVSSYPSPQSPILTAQTNMNYAYPLMSPSVDDDDLSTNPTPPPQPQQYVSRIPGTNTYQIITTHMYEDSENLEPIDVDEELLTDPSLMDADLAHDLSILNSIHTTASLSPEVYSDHSMSPGGIDATDNMQPFIPIFASNTNLPANVKLRLSPSSIDKLTCPPVISLPSDVVLPLDQQNSVMDVMSWWEQQQQQNHHHIQRS